MSTVKVNTLTGTTTAGSIAVTGEGNSTTTNLQQGLAKFWIDFNGSGTVAERDSFNSSSIGDGGTGYYSVNYTNAFSAATYAGVGTQENNYGTVAIPKQSNSLGTSSTNIQVTDGSSAYDSPYVHVILFGDLA